MFSFLKSKSNNNDSYHEAKSEVVPAVASDQSSQSSFSFMSAGSSQPPQHSEGAGSSAFSFMQSPATTQSEVSEDPAPPASSFAFISETSHQTPASSFSFMAESSADPQPAQSSFTFMAETNTPARSSFAFMSSDPQEHTPGIGQPDLLTSTDTSAQDLKLNKVAATKVVRKKKKSTKVGLGRDDDNEEVVGTVRRGSASGLELMDETAGQIAHLQDQMQSPVATIYDTPTSTTTHYVETVHWNVNDVPVVSAPIQVVEAAASAELPPPPPMYRPETPPNEPIAQVFEKKEEVAEATDVDATLLDADNNAIDLIPTETTSSESYSSEPHHELLQVPVASAEETASVVEAITSNPAVQYVTADTHRFEFLNAMTSSIHTPAATSATSSYAFLQEYSSDNNDDTNTTSENSNNTTDFAIPSNLNTDLQIVHDKLLTCITNLRINYETAYRSQEYLLQEIQQNQKQSLDTIERISFLESKQETLAKQEEFEQAEGLSAEIMELQKDLSNKTMTKNIYLTKLKKLQEDYQRSKQMLLEDIFRYLSTLSIHCAETSSKIEIFLNQLQSYQEEEESRISIEEHRVTLEQKHHEREEESLQQEGQIIEDAISTQVGDLSEKKTNLSEQLTTLQEEIRALEEQLLLKRSYEGELSKSLKSIDGKITDIRKKYDRQLVRIHERKEALHKVTTECDQEMALIMKSKNELFEQVNTSETLISETKDFIDLNMKEKTLITILLDDLQCSSTSTSSSSTSASDGIASLGLESCWDACVLVQASQDSSVTSSATSIMQQQMDQKTAELTKSLGHVNDLRIQYDFYYQKVHTLQEEIEKLELQKKLYASNKKFKEAATTAKELKDAMEHKEQASSQLQDVKTTLHEEENRHEELEKELQTLRAQFQELQKQEKLVHFAGIHGRIQTIRRFIQQLSSKKYITRKLRLAEKRGEVVDKSILSGLLGSAMKELYEEELQKLLYLREELCYACSMEVPVDEPLPLLIEEEEEDEEDDQIVSKKPDNNEKKKEEEVSEVETGEDLLIDTTEPSTPINNNSHTPGADIEVFPVHEESSNILLVEEEASVDTDNANDSEIVPTTTEDAFVPPVTEETAPEEPKISIEELEASIASLEADMDAAAELEDYDQAAILMEEITALKEQLDSLRQ